MASFMKLRKKFVNLGIVHQANVEDYCLQTVPKFLISELSE